MITRREQLRLEALYRPQKRILEQLSEAQAEWRRQTGARLVVLPYPPYFRYERDYEGGRESGAA